MVYKRRKGQLWTFQARTRTGWHPVTAPTTSKSLAARMAGMWETLANEHRAWDLLDPILSATRKEKGRKLGALYDAWLATKMNVVEVRRRIHDVDLGPLVDDYVKVHAKGSTPGWNEYVERFLRYLLPEGTTKSATDASVTWLTERLYAYPAGGNTLRRVHSGWSGFFDYCTKVRGLYPRNPMEDVQRPPEKKPPIHFYELETVERIIGWQPTQERRALFTLLYGTGIEIGTALRLTRADVAIGTREIRAAGTKAHTRHRVAIVADWAWPTIEEYVRPMLPAARLFPAHFREDEASHWHLFTVRALEITPEVKMHAARHHWAVMRLRAGTPVAVVQAQLGHSTPMLTLQTYGAFIPSGADRAHWEAQTTKHEAKRRGIEHGVEQSGGSEDRVVR